MKRAAKSAGVVAGELINGGQLSVLLLALLVQGSTGLIQLAGYADFRGVDYVSFTSHFIVGALVANVLCLNTEALILSGKISGSGYRLLLFCGILGLVLSGVEPILLSSSVPSSALFACWFFCSRMFLALFARVAPSPRVIIPCGVALVALFFLRAGIFFNVACYLSTLLAVAAVIARRIVVEDKGLTLSLWASLRTFAGYIPHTAAGFILSYSDRYAVIHFHPTSAAEAYLRIAQLASLAAFGVFPIVYAIRTKIINMSRVPTDMAIALMSATIAVGIGIAFVGAFFFVEVILVKRSLSEVPVAPAFVLAMVSAAAFAQMYQAFSMRIFMTNNYGFINRGTIVGALLSLAVAAIAIGLDSAVSWISLVPLVGWALVYFRVIWFFRRERMGAANAVDDEVPSRERY